METASAEITNSMCKNKFSPFRSKFLTLPTVIFE